MKNKWLLFALAFGLFTFIHTSSCLAYEYSGGAGTELDPYQIANKADLLNLAAVPDDYDKCFALTTDIDLSGIRFTNAVIAGATFNGVFDGNGYAVRDLLIVSASEYGAELGLFGQLGEDAVIRDLRLEDVFIIANDIVESCYIGGLCSENDGGTIERCSTTGLIFGGFEEGDDSSRGYVGGLCALNSGLINECFTDVDVYFSGGDTCSYIGGICGKTTGPSWGEEQSYIFNSYTLGALSVDGFNGYVGGVAGHCGGIVLRCYSASVIIGAENCNSVGGLIGYCGGNAIIRDSFWDMEASGLYFSDGGIGLFTSEMRDQEIFTDAGWDFAYEAENGFYDTWYMDGYPQLTCFDSAIPARLEITGPEFVDEGGSAQFICHASYYGDIGEDVSGQVVWTVDSESGISISPSGLLSVDGISHHLTLTVQAVYTVNGVRRSAVKSVVARNLSDYGGAGTADNPVLIMTKSELLGLASNPANYELHFLLGADIDLAGESFSSALIAPEREISFSGSFDGGGHVIRNLAITAAAADSSYLGLFGRVEGEDACVKNLRIENAVITGGSQSECVGTVCGYNGGMISNCFVSAEVSAGTGSIFIGGICGYNTGNMIASFAEGSVAGNDTVGGICGCHDWGVMEACGSRMSVVAWSFAGGLCGYQQSGMINRCFAEGVVAGFEFVGGVCGVNSYGVIANSYSIGGVFGDTDGAWTAGVCGFNMQGVVEFCYFAGMLAGGEFVGGVCGENTGDVDSCFWDMQVSTVSMSAGGSGLTTAEMQQVATFTSAGWDFVAESVNGAVDIWNMDDYPVLSGISFSVVPADGFTAWLSLAGVPLALSGEADTPALDGIPNLLKYACGLSVSTTYASADLYTMSLDEPGLFSIIYFKSKAATGVMLEAVWASTLAGPWTNTGVSYELLSDDGSREQWRASIRMENHGFMRLMAALVE